MTARERWSPTARRLGVASAAGLLAAGILYVLTITLWLIVEAAPGDPIGDPYLAVMEVLTIVSAASLLGVVIAIWCFADAAHRPQALATVALGSAGAVLTAAVHFVQLTAIRQLWQAGRLVDYRLVWPSALFAVEYFAWDILVGLTMAFAGLAMAGSPATVPARRALLLGGVLCLLGVGGPLSGRLVWQHVALLGYGVVLPVAAALMARGFRAVPPSDGAAAEPAKRPGRRRP